MKRVLRFFAPLFILAAGALTTSWLIANPADNLSVEVSGESFLPKVATIEVSPGNHRYSGIAYAQVEASERRTIASELSAALLTLQVELGDKVLQGQLLATMDLADLKHQFALTEQRRTDAVISLQLEQQNLRSSYENLQLERQLLELSEESTQRSEELYNKGLLSDDQWQQAERSLMQAKMTVVRNQQGIERGELQITRLENAIAQIDLELSELERKMSKAQILAPVAGVVQDIWVEAGQRVNTGTSLLAIGTADKRQIKAWIPASEIGRLSSTALLARGENYFPVQLAQIDNNVQSGIVQAWYEVPSQTAAPLNGELVEIVFTTDFEQPGYLVPAEALYDGEYIYHYQQGALVKEQVKVLGNSLENNQWQVVVAPVSSVNGTLRVLSTRLREISDGMAVEAI
jgi:multidrug efflux pump subunit AcrA (membrane-fusion protein)